MKVRALNDIEKTTAILHDYFNSHGTVCFRIKVQGTIKEELLLLALQKVQDDYLLLQTSIKKEGNHYYFHKTIPYAPIPLIVLNKKTDEQWKEEALLAINHRFATSQAPLAKLIILKSVTVAVHDILLIAHHAIVDVRSAVLFFDKLVKYYSELAKVEQNDKNIYLVHGYEKSEAEPEQWLGVNNFQLDARTTDKLIAVCRARDTTLFGLLAAVCLRIMQTNVGYIKPFSGVVPVSTRQQVPESEKDEFGCYMTIYKGLRFDPKNNLSFWELAKYYKNTLHDKLKNVNKRVVNYPKNPLIKWMLLAYYKLIKLLGSLAPNNIGLLVINNAGKHQVTHENIQVKEFNFLANVTFLQKNRFFINAITINGSLCITLRTSFRNISNDSITKKIFNLLNKIANEEHFV